jgi:hypothetical protein
MRGWVKKFLKILGVLVALYVVLTAGLYAAMRQPPDRFGRMMAKLPGPMFFVLPFKPLWFHARQGDLKPGDAAPNFILETVDKKTTVTLAAFRESKPVVLVFGSYT